MVTVGLITRRFLSNKYLSGATQNIPFWPFWLTQVFFSQTNQLLFSFVKPDQPFDFVIQRVGQRAGQIKDTHANGDTGNFFFIKLINATRQTFVDLDLEHDEQIDFSASSMRSIAKSRIIERYNEKKKKE